MKELTKTIYQCEYCGKELYSKQDAEFHEKVCYFNPNRIGCDTCAYGLFLLDGETTQIMCDFLSGECPTSIIPCELLNFAAMCSKYKYEPTYTNQELPIPLKGETK